MSLRSKIFFISALTVSLTSAAAFAGDAKKGEELYQTNCSACHGDKGQGRGGPMGWFTGGGGEVTALIGNQLSNQTMLSMASDEFLKTAILEGRPDRPMIAWKGTLTDSDVADVIAFMRTWQTEPKIELSSKPVKGNAKNGKELFRGSCGACHGYRGEGTDAAPALNNQVLLGSAPDDFFRQTMMRGRKGTIMRSFAKNNPDANVDLEASDVDDIVAFIRSWEKKGKK